MNDTSTSTAQDVQVSERLQPIEISGEYEEKYRSVVHIRDLPPLYFDEPRELGGSNKGGTPLETVLSSLVACTAMIVYIIKMEHGFKSTGMSFKARAMHDVRRAVMRATGKKYSQIEPIAKHYHSVSVEFTIKTEESDERLSFLASETERLCPVVNLLRDAGVPLDVKWIRA